MQAGLNPFNGDLELFEGPHIPPLGDAVLSNFESLYGKNANPEAAMSTYLKDFMRFPTTFKLGDAGKYKGVPVTWIPGHEVSGTHYGPARNDVAVIGNMVSMDETSMLSLTHSDSSSYLRNTMSSYGLSLDGMYITTVSKFSPPYQGISKMPAKWAKECKYFLYQELLNVKPKYVLLMGSEVLKAIMGKGATLKEYRGQTIDIPWIDAKGIVTLSPYAVMRNPEKTQEFQTDIRYFHNLVTGKEQTGIEDCRYETVWEIERLRELVDYLMQFNVYAVDVETTGLDSMEGEILTIQICPRPKEAYVIALKSLVSGRRFNASTAKVVQQLSRVLDRDGVCIAGHNFRFDMTWLKRIGLDLTTRFSNYGFDTILASHLLNEVNDHSLSACTIRDTDMGRYDAKMEEYLSQGLEHKDVPDEDLHYYGAADTDATYRLYELYRARLWEYHLNYCTNTGLDPYSSIMSPGRARVNKVEWPNTLWNLFKYIVMPVGDSICEMEMTGFLVDKPLLLDMIRKFADKRDEILRKLRYMLQKPDFNPRSPQQCQEILFDDPAKEDENGCVIGCLGLRPVTTTGKRPKQWEEVEDRGEVWYEDGRGWRSNQHAPGTGGEVLSILVDEQGSEVASVLKDFRAIDQICKNFLAGAEEDKLTGEMEFKKGLVGMSGSDNRLHTSISQLTDTGRWRSSKPNCFSGDTEVLTEEGWVRFDKLNKEVKLAQYDVDTEEIDFAKPIGYVSDKDTILNLTNRTIDLAVTPDHDCMVKDSNDTYVVKAAAYPNNKNQVCAGYYRRKSGSVSDNMLKLYAIICSYGYIHEGSGDICFNIPSHDMELERYKRNAADSEAVREARELRCISRLDTEEILNEFNIKYTVLYHSGNYSARFRFIKHAKCLELHKWITLGPHIFKLSGDSLHRFFCYLDLVPARQWRKPKSKEFIDWVQIIGVLTGNRVKLKEPRDDSEGWVGFINGKSIVSTRGIKVTNTYIDKVYCVKMPKGTVVVRRNGRVCIQKNCQNIPKGREGEIAAIFGDQKIPTIRSAMIAKPGHVIVEADFDSAETYTLAYIADDKVMKEDLQKVDSNGKSISLHSSTAVNVFKLDMTVEEYDVARKTDKQLAGLRVAAKSVRRADLKSRN